MGCVAPCLKGLCVTVICDTSLAQKLVFYNDFWCLPAWCVSLKRNWSPRSPPPNCFIGVVHCINRGGGKSSKTNSESMDSEIRLRHFLRNQ